MVCAHYISNYLFTTINWLYSILKPSISYEPIVFARKVSNLDEFPIKKLFALSHLRSLDRTFNMVVYKTAGYFPFLCQAAKENSVDILHAHFGYDGFKMLPLKRKLAIPMIVSFLGVDASRYLRSKKWQKKYGRLFVEADLFLSLGPKMREALIEAGCPPDKVKVHNLGIKVGDFPFRQRNLDEGKRVNIVMGASFREKKGIPYALKAAAILKRQCIQFKLVIAGDGELRPQIEHLVLNLGLYENVELLGYVAPFAFRKIMAEAHIVILPSITADDGDMEGTPFVLIEALAMGIPVVSTYHADIPKIVTDGVNGFLVPERDADALVDRLIYLIEHPECWGRMGMAGREHVMKNFNAAKQFERLKHIYTSLL